MNDVYYVTSNDRKEFGREKIFQLYVYILLKSQPKRFHSNLKFIQNFSNDKIMDSETGIMLK